MRIPLLGLSILFSCLSSHAVQLQGNVLEPIDGIYEPIDGRCPMAPYVYKKLTVEVSDSNIRLFFEIERTIDGSVVSYPSTRNLPVALGDEDGDHSTISSDGSTFTAQVGTKISQLRISGDELTYTKFYENVPGFFKFCVLKKVTQ